MLRIHKKIIGALMFIYRQFRVRPIAVCAFFFAMILFNFVPEIARAMADGTPVGEKVLIFLVGSSVGVPFFFFVSSFMIYYVLRVNGVPDSEIEEYVQ